MEWGQSSRLVMRLKGSSWWQSEAGGGALWEPVLCTGVLGRAAREWLTPGGGRGVGSCALQRCCVKEQVDLTELTDHAFASCMIHGLRITPSGRLLVATEVGVPGARGATSAGPEAQRPAAGACAGAAGACAIGTRGLAALAEGMRSGQADARLCGARWRLQSGWLEQRLVTAWSHEEHRYHPPAFRAAARQLLHSAAAQPAGAAAAAAPASGRRPPGKQAATAGGRRAGSRKAAVGGSTLAQVPGAVLESALGLAARPLSAWAGLPGS